MTGAEKNGNGTAEFKGLLNDRISWDGCMDKKERLTTRDGIKDWFIYEEKNWPCTIRDSLSGSLLQI